MYIRDLTAEDQPRVLELNNAAVPAVGELDVPELASIVGMSSVRLVTEADGVVVAFALAMGPGTEYTSPNYRYFDERMTDFCYLDRIVVDPAYYRRGLGSQLYDEVERRCGAGVLTCEVNLRPPNPESLAFHEHRGFQQVGTQHTSGGAKTVSLLEKKLR